MLFILIIIVFSSVLVEAQGVLIYDSKKDSYTQGNYVYYYNANSGLYTTQAMGAGGSLFRALRPDTGQVVVYSNNQPTQIYNYDQSGAYVSSQSISQSSEQYSSFLPLGSGYDPVAAPTIPTVPLPNLPAPGAAPVQSDEIIILDEEPAQPGLEEEPFPSTEEVTKPAVQPAPPSEEEELESLRKTQTQGGTVPVAPAPASAGTGETTGAPAALPKGFSVIRGAEQPGGPGAAAPGAQPGQPTYYVYGDQVLRREPGSTAEPPKGAVQISQSLANSIPSDAKIKVAVVGGNVAIKYTDTNYADNLFEDYKTETTVVVVASKDAEGRETVTKTQSSQTYICGSSVWTCERYSENDPEVQAGTAKEGDRKFKPLPGSAISESATYASISTTKDGKVKGNVLTKETKVVYDKKDNSIATMNIDYRERKKEDPLGQRQVSQIEVTGSDGKPIYKITVNPDGSTNPPTNNLDKVEPRENREKLAGKIVSTGALGWADAWYALSWQQSLDRAVQGYYEYQGLRQLSGLFWPDHAAEVQARQEKIKQDFCVAAGISNCLTSVICGSIFDLEADNVISGRGPGGQFVSSAVVNAEKTPAIEVAGMTRQQLIDMFGNTTVISGRLFNLTDATFDPKVLGRIKIRLYHVQYSIRNNGICEGEECEKSDMTYNLLFVRVPQELNTSYGKTVSQAYWFTGAKLPVLKHLESAKDDIYKFSATEYSDVCLTFNPGLPSGSAMSSEIVNKLCVPFKESLAPAPISQQPGGGAAPAPALAGGAPGGTI